MKHNREEVIARTVQEFELLDGILAKLDEQAWNLPVPRPETKDPWSVKDTVAHITHWKADVVRKIHKQRIPAEERGLNINNGNHLIYLRWHTRTPQEVLAWHRQVQADLLAALHEAPDEWFSGRERNAQWPYDLDGHSAWHRTRDIQRAGSC